MSLDFAALRRETRATCRVAHFDNAGCALPPDVVPSAVIEHLELEAELGGYEAEAQRHEALNQVYCGIAKLLNCDTDEVFLFESGTLAFKTIVNQLTLRPDDKVVVSSGEFGANLKTLRQLAITTGCTLEVIPDDNEGNIDVDRFQDTSHRVRLISAPIIPANGAAHNPASILRALFSETDAVTVVDACQAVGQMPIDVRILECDVLVFTGRKYLRGPRGTAGLYLRREFIDKLSFPSRSSQRTKLELETLECSFAARIGLGAAVSYIPEDAMEAIYSKVTTLAHFARERLSKIPAVRLLDKGTHPSNIVSFTVNRHESRDIRERLRKLGFNVGISRRSNTPIDMSLRNIKDAVRVSGHYYNTLDEVERLVEAVQSLIKDSR